jgi:hypothetical protein
MQLIGTYPILSGTSEEFAKALKARRLSTKLDVMKLGRRSILISAETFRGAFAKFFKNIFPCEFNGLSW